MKNLTRALAGALMVLCVLSTPGFAQSTAATGTVDGTCKDQAEPQLQGISDLIVAANDVAKNAPAPKALPKPVVNRPALAVPLMNQGQTPYCNYYALAMIMQFHHNRDPRNRFRHPLDQMPANGWGPPTPGLVTIALPRKGWTNPPGKNGLRGLDDRGFIGLANMFGYATVDYSNTFGPTGTAPQRAVADAAAIAQLEALLAAGNPPAIGFYINQAGQPVRGNDPTGGGHAGVAVGVVRDATGQITHITISHSWGVTTNMPYTAFMNSWRDMGYNMIGVTPPH